MQQDFNVEVAKATDWEPDTYGNRWYSVKFKELEQAVLWKAKTEPTVDSVVYGHLEASKSGKSKIFKKDAKPDGFTPQHKAAQYSEGDTGKTINLLENAIQRLEEQEKKLDDIIAKCNILLGNDQELVPKPPRDWNSVGKDKVYNSTEMPPDFGLPPEDLGDLEPM